ncbi:MAG: ABC transporter ATP-binding protein [Acidobacteriota bacterium]
MSDHAILIEGLTVSYGDHVAVSELDLRVERGQVCGLIGPNGAGKSTTMKVLATLQEPDEGRVEVLGRNLREEAHWVRWHLGFMPDVIALPEQLTVEQYLRYGAGIHALPPERIESAVDDVVALTDLQAHREKDLGGLSKGMRQRLFLARTLLPEPELLILDEPASGLDPRARVELRELIRELQRMGRTVLISSHVLADLAEVCDAIAIIEAGRTVAHGSLDDIRARSRSESVVRLEMVSEPEAARELLAAHALVQRVDVEGRQVFVSFTGGREELARLLNELARADHLFCTVSLEGDDLENLFLKLTEGVVS